MVLAHDATQVAIVGVGVEGDAPGTGKLLDGESLASGDGFLVATDDELRMSLNRGDIAVFGVKIATLA